MYPIGVPRIAFDVDRGCLLWDKRSVEGITVRRGLCLHPVFADWPKDGWLTSFLANGRGPGRRPASRVSLAIIFALARLIH